MGRLFLRLPVNCMSENIDQMFHDEPEHRRNGAKFDMISSSPSLSYFLSYYFSLYECQLEGRERTSRHPCTSAALHLPGPGPPPPQLAWLHPALPLRLLPRDTLTKGKEYSYINSFIYLLWYPEPGCSQVPLIRSDSQALDGAEA